MENEEEYRYSGRIVIIMLLVLFNPLRLLDRLPDELIVQLIYWGIALSIGYTVVAYIFRGKIKRYKEDIHVLAVDSVSMLGFLIMVYGMEIENSLRFGHIFIYISIVGMLMCHKYYLSKEAAEFKKNVIRTIICLAIAIVLLIKGYKNDQKVEQIVEQAIIYIEEDEEMMTFIGEDYEVVGRPSDKRVRISDGLLRWIEIDVESEGGGYMVTLSIDEEDEISRIRIYQEHSDEKVERYIRK